MEEYLAHDLIAIENRPTPTLRRVHLVVAVLCELDARLAFSGAWSVVNLATDVAELKLADAIGLEFEEALDLGVHE